MFSMFGTARCIARLPVHWADGMCCAAGKTAMVTPTGVAPHIPFHLGPVQPPLDTPTPTGGGENGHQPPGLAAPPGLPQPASNMSAAQQLKDRLMKGLHLELCWARDVVQVYRLTGNVIISCTCWLTCCGS